MGTNHTGTNHTGTNHTGTNHTGTNHPSPHPSTTPAPLPSARVLRSVNKSYNEVFPARFSPPRAQCAGSTVIELCHQIFSKTPGTEVLPNF